MQYLIKILKSIKIVIITSLTPLLITVISSFIYNKITSKDITIFINYYLIYILLFYYLVTLIYLIRKYKIIFKRLSLVKYYSYVSIGISLSCILNMLIFLINKTEVTGAPNKLILLITSSLIGPIYEEIIFRSIFYNKLKEFNSTKKSIIITTIVFLLLHLNITKIIYAFILGLILNTIYEKDNNITSPIIIHIGANMISLFLFNYTPLILILSIILLIVSLYTILDKRIYL